MELVSLPEDALMCVLSQLPYTDLLNVSSTCRLLHGFSRSDLLWMRLCQPWRFDVDLEEWRAGTHSAVTLFRLLSSLSKLVGYWTAPELEPKGGLLYICWGHLSVDAHRILVQRRGELKMQHIFDVMGLLDGSTRLRLFASCTTPSGERGLSLSGALVWLSPNEDEFYVELAQNMEGSWLPGPGRSKSCGQSEPTLEETVDDDQTRSESRSSSPDAPGEMDLANIESLLSASFGLGRFYFEGFVQEHQAYAIDSARRIGGSLHKKLIIEETDRRLRLAGLWVGVYGPHGVEIINVSYTEEHILATKVIGDPNVPAGQVTFKAELSTESSDVPSIIQALLNYQVGSDDDPFTIVKLFQGYGQIAETGYVFPQWVPGQLLIDQHNNIAFMWQDDNFVIPFQRLDVPQLYHELKESQALVIM